MWNIAAPVLVAAAALLGAALIVRAAVHARRSGGAPIGADSAPTRSAGHGSHDPHRPSVVGWRFGRLFSAGVDAHLALLLAERPDVDIHTVLALIRRGCPAPLAARITEPLPRRSPTTRV